MAVASLSLAQGHTQVAMVHSSDQPNGKKINPLNQFVIFSSSLLLVLLA